MTWQGGVKQIHKTFFFVFLESLGFNFDNKSWNPTTTYLWESPFYHDLPRMVTQTVDDQFMWIVPFYKPPVCHSNTSLDKFQSRLLRQWQPSPKLKGRGFIHSVSFERNSKVRDFYSSQQKYNNNRWMKIYLDTILPKRSSQGWRAGPVTVMGRVIWKFCYRLFKSLVQV